MLLNVRINYIKKNLSLIIMKRLLSESPDIGSLKLDLHYSFVDIYGFTSLFSQAL